MWLCVCEKWLICVCMHGCRSANRKQLSGKSEAPHISHHISESLSILVQLSKNIRNHAAHTKKRPELKAAFCCGFSQHILSFKIFTHSQHMMHIWAFFVAHYFSSRNAESRFLIKRDSILISDKLGARLVSTRRPITPRDPKRQLYGRVAPPGRPPSAFRSVFPILRKSWRL